MEMQDMAKLPEMEPAQLSVLAVQIFTALGIVLFLVLAFILFRRLARGAGRTRPSSGMRETRFTVPDTGMRRAAQKLLLPRTPRETVRWYYRKFLLKVLASGIDLAPSDTTESITRAAAALFDRELVLGLQAIYLVARYSPEAVTREDARRARTLYGKLKATGDTDG
jgi:hypothetical protein